MKRQPPNHTIGDDSKMKNKAGRKRGDTKQNPHNHYSILSEIRYQKKRMGRGDQNQHYSKKTTTFIYPPPNHIIMSKKENDIESEEEKIEEKRVELLKQKSRRLRCRICGAPVRVRLTDGAEICREGGHIVYPDGCVTLPGGLETTIQELIEKGVIKGVK